MWNDPWLANSASGGLASFVLALTFLLLIGGAAPGEQAVVSDLNAQCRNGQVFLTWREADTPAGTTFNVYVSTSLIASPAQAALVAHHIEAHSARNWYQDPDSFERADKPAAPATPVGFVIESGKPPLDPAGGLFVYTVSKANEPALFFAVTTTDPQGHEERNLLKGRNALDSPVKCKAEPIQAIWQGSDAAPTKEAAKGKPLFLDLHYRHGGGLYDNLSYFVLFGDATMGWRQGLPVTFSVQVKDNAVTIAPRDRAWTGGRRQAGDNCPAVNTWWFGYNSRFCQAALEPEKVVNNYTERWLLAVLHWAQAYLTTDRPATYVVGGSMGGSGAVAMCLHYPDEFAAAVAEVPMVRFVSRPIRTLNRLEAVCGRIDDSTRMPDGTRLVDYVDGVWQAKNNPRDLPYLMLLHGRSDTSIPWVNNPPFYRAMNHARQGISVCWNNFGHQDMYRHVPADVKAWQTSVLRYRLDASFPVFSDNSDDKNCGSGDPADGDLVGWINRGVDWKDVVDTKTRYAITILANHPDITYPVTATVSFRRLQQFRVSAGQRLQVKVGADKPREIAAGPNGLITVPDVTIPEAAGVRIEVTR